ncbi:MAG TPA: cytochrome c oxidase assembly protein [Mycobacteriales bacterium]|nr:cytochrome c oxidase assembly protein [Mycobacteriales bacterium]
MTSLAPLTIERFLSTWRFDLWATLAAVGLLSAYAVGLVRARRRGIRWPWSRVAAFAVLGVGLLVVGTMSSLTIYSRVLLWPAALQVTLLLTVVPVGLGLGDPLGLVTAGLGSGGATRWRNGLHHPVVRVLTYPIVAPLLALATQFLVFFTGYLGAAQRSTTVMDLLELQLVVTGCLFALPLLGFEVLPRWCTQPVRMALAGVDGLLDAIPGIAVMTSSALVAGGYYGTVTRDWGPSRSWDQTIGGGLMITVAEVVAIPFVAIIYRAWIREDASAAAIVDHQLDVAEERRVLSAADTDGPVADLPWWEIDPGPLADRAARYGWRERDSP